MTFDLFMHERLPPLPDEEIAPSTWLFRDQLAAESEMLLEALEAVLQQVTLRQMRTPGGYTMSIQTASCGTLGWVSDERGYRYAQMDPHSGNTWPMMPEPFLALACRYAERAGFADFQPDACLINCYRPGARLSLHQDKDERDFGQPIVSVSLGLPAVFLLGGLKRQDPVQRVVLQHGDVLVWGGESRLRYHGVAPVKAGMHPLLGERRINLTFRKAG